MDTELFSHQVAEREESTDVDGTRQVHYNWQAKAWRYLSHDCEDDVFQEEDMEEESSLLLGEIHNSTLPQIICGQRVVNSRARLRLLELND